MTGYVLPLLVALGTLAIAQEPCPAVVEYTASTGDPARANGSALFRGFAQVAFRKTIQPQELVALGWTFTAGERIQGERDVFEDHTPEVPEGTISDIVFGSLTKADTQSVELAINSSDPSRVRLGFIGFKGSNTTSSADVGGETVYQVALPQAFLVDDFVCRAAPDLLQTEVFVSEPLEDAPSRLQRIRLDYLPLEFRSLPFSEGLFPSQALFAIRLVNVQSEPIDLNSVTLEYWFEGDDVAGIYERDAPVELQYQSSCVLSSIICSAVWTSVEMGLEDVQGAQYFVRISFGERAGKLLPSPQGDGQSEAVSGLEVVVNITSLRVLSGLDVTADYSFVNTQVLPGDDGSSERLVRRAYEPNRRIPVYEDGELVWGSPPTAGLAKVNSSEIDEAGNFCYLKSNTIPVRLPFQTCGGQLLVQQCQGTSFSLIDRPGSGLSPPNTNTTSANDKDRDDGIDDVVESSTVPTWVVVLIVAGTVAVMALCYLFVACRPGRSTKSSFVTYQEMTRNPISPFANAAGETFGSFAWSIEHTGDDDRQRLLSRHRLSEQGEQSTAKFHTVPSISESEGCTLVKLVERQTSLATASGSEKGSTWTGCIHWMWEPWKLENVSRIRTVAVPSKRVLSFQNSTRHIQHIRLDVDYAKEIQPFLGPLLGEGGFGQVYEARWNGQSVAVKMMKIDTEVMYKTLRDEVKLTSRICHERVVRLLAACLADKNRICLIMELVENGSLSKRIHNRKLRKLEYIEVLQIALDIAEGLNYLHPTIIHRDLKPQNVLLDKDGRAKIADFGISKFKDPHRSYLSVTQTGGTPNYMAPELFNGTRVDEKCDIYSLGCVLYEAMTRTVPLSELPTDHCAPLFQIIKTVAIDKRRPKIPEYFPHGLAQVVRQCWKDNPRTRPSASQVCTLLESLLDEEIADLEKSRKAYRRTGNQATGLSRCVHSRYSLEFDFGKMISNTYVGLSLLGICAVVGAGVGIGSGVAMIAQEAVKQEQQSMQAAKIPAAPHSVFERTCLDFGFATREA